MVMQKLAPSDIESYDWDWSSKYVDAIEQELIAVFSASFIGQFPDAIPNEVQRNAAEWAREHGAELIRDVVDVTKDRVRELVATSVEEGQGTQALARLIRDDHIFSKSRAATVARTETAQALGQGAKRAAIAQDRDIKRWFTQDDHLVRPGHLANAEQGWIPIGDIFQNGEDTISLPNCRCNVQYGNSALVDSFVRGVVWANGTFHCVCGQFLRKVPPIEEMYCRKCKRVALP